MNKNSPNFMDARKQLALVMEQGSEEQSFGTQQIQQKGVLHERGIRKCTSYRKLPTTDVIGDCQQNSCRLRYKNVQQTINEFAEQLRSDVSYAQTMGRLMEKGIRTYEEFIPSDNLLEHLREEYVEPPSQSTATKELLIENGLSWSWEMKEKTFEENSIDMHKIANDINQFANELESDADDISWSEFRRNLLKIHLYYKKQQSPQNEIEEEASMEQVEDSNHIESVNSFDAKMEELNKKYNQTLINREKAFKDLITFQSMREKIEKKLKQIELEIHASRTQLTRQRGVLNK